MTSTPGALDCTQKDERYFSGVRRDDITALPNDPDASVLELGCAGGTTGAVALAEGKCGRYCGIELFGDAARLASTRLTEVVTGDVATLDLPWAEQSFDALILSEVLEHLADPRAVLQPGPLLKPGARVFASAPNVSHHSIVRQLLRGDFRLEDSGVMDRTHLRWFTPKTFAELVETTVFAVESVRPLNRIRWPGRLFNLVTAGLFHHLLWYQIDVRARRR